MGSIPMRALLLTLAAAVAGSGCRDIAGAANGEAAETGVLQLVGYGGTRPASLSGAPDWSVVWNQAPNDSSVITPAQVIVAPAVVQRGQPFGIVVHTIGPSGCWRAEGQTMRVVAPVVELTPYDVHSGANFCTGVLVDLVHASTVTLDQPGEWTLRVVGRRVHYMNTSYAVPVTAEKVIVVQ
jgi:hypothetical protein